MRKSRRPLMHAHAGCGKHPLEPAAACCTRCNRRCCPRCAVEVRRRTLCIDCGLLIGGITARRRTL
jgi:hypothetical protein